MLASATPTFHSDSDMHQPASEKLRGGGGGGVTNNLKSKSECLEINHETEDETAVLACALSTFHHDRKLMWREGGGWIGKGGGGGG